MSIARQNGRTSAEREWNKSRGYEGCARWRRVRKNTKITSYSDNWHVDRSETSWQGRSAPVASRCEWQAGQWSARWAARYFLRINGNIEGVVVNQGLQRHAITAIG